jgi:hypothetical protein
VLIDIGFVQRDIVNRNTGHIVDGHARVTLALRHSQPKIPVVYVDLSEDEERLVLATLDPIAAMANTDAAMLNDLLDDLHVEDARVEALLNSLAADLPDTSDASENERAEFGDLGSPVIQYTIIFDTSEHQETFYALAKHLKSLFPDEETLSARLALWISQLELKA